MDAKRPPVALRADEIIIRLAKESDRAALESIAARTWDGHDYLPQVLAGWLADPAGEFCVAQAGPGGPVVGAAKLTRFSPQEWWLEGMRVDPDYYGLGIGMAIHRHLVRRAIALSGQRGVLRYSTDVENGAVHRMAVQTGFHMAARFQRLTASASSALPGADDFERLTPDAVPAARAYLDGSATYIQAAQSAVGRRRWSARLITGERLHAWAAQGQLFAWKWKDRLRRDAGMDGLMIAGEYATDDGRELVIEYLDAAPGGLALLAEAARSLAAALHCERTWHMLLYRPERIVAVEQAGWRCPADLSGRACLFARSLNEPEQLSDFEHDTGPHDGS
ncbi:MAG: GNAT family N-acetyltransferase [Anaerolineae bacterium]|nr:GNAT family N-acetyltransferase [Anaerolineae bacterium]